MKICFISNTSWSLYNFRRNLINELLKKNHKVYIVSSLDRTSDDFKSMGCIPINLNFSQKGRNIFKEFYSLLKLFRILFKIKPDYILNFTIKPIIYCGLLNYLFNYKIISTLDGLGHAFPKNSFLFFNFSKFLLKLSLKKNYKFFAVNKSDYLFYKKHKICKNEILFYIQGTGIDTKYYSPNLKIKNNITNFVMISRILKIKGVDLYLELANNFINNKDMKFTLVAPGKFLDYSSNLHKKCMKFNEMKIINLLEDIKDIRKILCDADCLIHPTSYNEGLPRVILEAASMGIPTITTNTAGCIDIIQNNYTGIICRQNDLECLIKSVKFFHDMPDNKKNRLGINARSKVEQNFEEHLVIKKYLEIINE